MASRLKPIHSYLPTLQGIGGQKQVSLKTKTLTNIAGNELIEHIDKTSQASVEDQLMKVSNDINNSIYQLHAIGISEKQFQEETDTRNFINKFLGFKADVPLALNILDLLNRPANTVRGLIVGYDASGNFNPAQALWDGLTNKKEYGASEILKTIGIDITQFPTLLRIPFSIAADMATDPLTFWNTPMNLVTKGLSKGAKNLARGVRRALSVEFGGTVFWEKLTGAIDDLAYKFKEAFGIFKNAKARELLGLVFNRNETLKQIYLREIQEHLIHIDNTFGEIGINLQKNFTKAIYDGQIPPELARQIQELLPFYRQASADEIVKGMRLKAKQVEGNDVLKAYVAKYGQQLENGDFLIKGLQDFNTDDWKRVAQDITSTLMSRGTEDISLRKIIELGLYKRNPAVMEWLSKNTKPSTIITTDLMQKCYTDLGYKVYRAEIRDGANISYTYFLKGNEATYNFETLHGMVNKMIDNSVAIDGVGKVYILPLLQTYGEDTRLVAKRLTEMVAKLSGISEKSIVMNSYLFKKNVMDTRGFITKGGHLDLGKLKQAFKDKADVVHTSKLQNLYSPEEIANAKKVEPLQALFQNEGAMNEMVRDKLTDKQYNQIYPYKNSVEEAELLEYEHYAKGILEYSERQKANIKRIAKKQNKLQIKKNRVTTSTQKAYEQGRRGFNRMVDFKNFELDPTQFTKEEFRYRKKLKWGQINLFKDKVGRWNRSFDINVYQFPEKDLFGVFGNKDVALMQIVKSEGNKKPVIVGYRIGLFCKSNSVRKTMTEKLTKAIEKSEKDALKEFGKIANEMALNAQVIKRVDERSLVDSYTDYITARFRTAKGRSEELFMDMTAEFGTTTGFKETAFKREIWNSMNLAQGDAALNQAFETAVRKEWLDKYDEVIRADLIDDVKYSDKLATIDNASYSTHEQIQEAKRLTQEAKQRAEQLGLDQPELTDVTIESEGIRRQEIINYDEGGMLVISGGNNDEITEGLLKTKKLLDSQTILSAAFDSTREIPRVQAMIDYAVFNSQLSKMNVKPLDVKAGQTVIDYAVIDPNDMKFIDKVNEYYFAIQNLFENGIVDFTNQQKTAEELMQLLQQVDTKTKEKIVTKLSEKQKNRIKRVVWYDENKLYVDTSAVKDMYGIFSALQGKAAKQWQQPYFNRLADILKDPNIDPKLYSTLKSSGKINDSISQTNRWLNSQQKHNIKQMRQYAEEVFEQQHNLSRTFRKDMKVTDNRIWLRSKGVDASKNILLEDIDIKAMIDKITDDHIKLNAQTNLFAERVLDDENGEVAKLFKYRRDFGDLYLPTPMDAEFVNIKMMEKQGVLQEGISETLLNGTYGGNVVEKLTTKSHLSNAATLNVWANGDLFSTSHYKTLATNFGLNAKAFEKFSLLKTSVNSDLIRVVPEELILKTLGKDSIYKVSPKDLENFAKNFGEYNEWMFLDAKGLNEFKTNIELYKNIAGREYGVDNLGDWVVKLDKMIETGEKIIVHRGTMHFLNAYAKQSASLFNGTSKFWSFIDEYVVKWFKKISTFSAGFHARNMITNYMNAYLGGINPYELTKHSVTANNELSQIRKVFEKVGKELTQNPKYKQAFNLKEVNASIAAVLSKNEYETYLLGLEYLEKGLLGANKFNDDIIDQYFRIINQFKSGMNKQLPTSQIKKTWEQFKSIFEKSQMLGKHIDEMHKVSAYHFAKTQKGQQMMKELNFVNPEDYAKYIFFDYDNLSPFEYNVLRKAFPFYTWMRKNFEFHLHNFAKNSERYARLLQAYRGWRDAFITDPEQEEAYLKYSKIPIFDNGSGRITYISSPLPILSFFQVWTGTDIVDGLNPLFKWPFEQVLGLNLFTGKPKKEWKYLPFGFDYVFDIPKYIINSMADRTNIGRADIANLGLLGNKFMQFANSGLNWLTIGDPNFNPFLWFPSLFQEYDINKVALNQRIRYAHRLNEYMNQLRLAGKYVPRYDEILPNQYGYVNPKYKNLSPRIDMERLNKYIRSVLQKDYKR